MVLLEGIELSTSPLPRECSTTELQQRRVHPHRGPAQPDIGSAPERDLGGLPRRGARLQQPPGGGNHSLDEACGFAGSLNAPGFSDLN
jgi:hypothetical protein